MDNKQIRELMTWMEKTSMKKLVLKNQKVELTLEREENAQGLDHAQPVFNTSSNPMQHELEEHRLSSSPSRQKENSLAKEKHTDSDGQTINSPMVGTFYASPSPEAEPFVKEGDTVTEETVVGIVEAMKVMNEIKARVSGKITEPLVSNGDPVEFGTPLFRVD